MKKYILTETQLKKVINYLIGEQMGGLQCATSKLKDITQGKFNVESIDGEVKFNGKYYNNDSPRPILLLPETEITLCMSNTIYLTNGYKIEFDYNKLRYSKMA